MISAFARDVYKGVVQGVSHTGTVLEFFNCDCKNIMCVRLLELYYLYERQEDILMVSSSMTLKAWPHILSHIKVTLVKEGREDVVFNCP